MVIWIPAKFPSLNEYINAERRHRMIAAKMKKEWTQLVVDACYSNATGIGPTNEEFPLTIKFIVHEENKRRDVDNVSSMVGKFCLDGMVKAGLLTDDSQKYVKAVEYEIIIDGKIGVEIII